MRKNEPPDFIIIDDEVINNYVSQKYIQSVFRRAKVQTFTSPVEGLNYIETTGSVGQKPAVIFLDINMPVLTGWDVLDRLSHLPGTILRQLTIFILSSSIAAEDKLKAHSNPLVAGYIEKPLNINHLMDISERLHIGK